MATNTSSTRWEMGTSKRRSDRMSARRARSSPRPFKDQIGTWHNGTSFGLNDLEALMNVAFEAKEWITAHTLKR